ncbi:MAG: polysaccharide deacetylase family protein [Pseudomonadota bacterium]
MSRQEWGRTLLLVIASLVTACATPQQREVIAENDQFIAVLPDSNDTLQTLAQDLLGTSTRSWEIAELNGITSLDRVNHAVVVPKKPTNPSGVYPNGVRKLQVLCFHRFVDTETSRHLMEVPINKFEEQIAYLKAEGYTFLTLAEASNLKQQRAGLPERAITITIDDGFRSVYDLAYPVLKKHNVPATVFLYVEFLGSPAALTWSQIEEMADSGLVTFDSHTFSHDKLTKAKGETKEAFQKRLTREVASAKRKLGQKLDVKPHSFAYPYGAASERAIAILEAAGYRYAYTVNRGGNTLYADNYLLKRTMIYGTDSFDQFQKKIDVFDGLPLK